MSLPHDPRRFEGRTRQRKGSRLVAMRAGATEARAAVKAAVVREVVRAVAALEGVRAEVAMGAAWVVVTAAVRAVAWVVVRVAVMAVATAAG